MDDNTRKIAHLMRRAGFSCGAEELQQRAADGLDATLATLIQYENTPDTVTNLSLGTDPQKVPLERIQAWWLNRMLKSPRPLQEKMTLFWHGHFATANSKVDNTLYMVAQNQFFRDNALGNFETILLGVSRDPAMLVWLDNISNTKDAPNENYGREIMELFTLGLGNYTEADVKAGARAFTGWQIKNDKFWVDILSHDFSSKVYLGQTGRFNGDDVVRLLVNHPATPGFLARKMLRFFATLDPSQEWVDRIAGVYASTSGSIRAMVSAILQSPEFYSADSMGATYKSPVEFSVGALKEVGATMPLLTLAGNLTEMGQDLFNPPTVKGWDGGQSWINTSSMLARINFAGQLVAATGGALATSKLLAQLQTNNVTTAAAVVEFYAERLGGVLLAAETQAALVHYLNTSSSGVTGPFKLTSTSVNIKVRNMLRLLLSAPEYQVQ